MPKTSPVDRLGKDDHGHPDYSWGGRFGAQLRDDFPQITRQGKSGTPHVDIEGQFNYGKPAPGLKPKAIVDPTGKTIKVSNDDHGMLHAIQTASQKARVPVPQHVMVLMAQGANDEANRRVGDHRAHLERGTKGKARDEAKNQLFTAPFLSILKIGEQHVPGPHLRRFANALAGEFRDGASHALPDGTESPLPLPLASLARHYLTADERRNGTTLADILPDVDKQFHDGLKRHARLADTAARNVHDIGALQAAAQSRADLKTLGAHHTAALAQTRKQTRDDDAKEPAEARAQKVRDYGAKVDGEADATMAPMSDEDLKNFQAVVDRLVADPDQFTEVSALPNAAQGGAHHTAARVHIVRALEEAAAREAGKTPDQRQPLEVLLAHTLVEGLGPRAHSQIQRAQKEGDAKTFHALAHRDMKSDRHTIARAIVEGYHDTPEKSLCALLHVDPFRVARRVVGTLPEPDEMLRLLTEQGVVKPKAAETKGKNGKSGGQSGSQSGGQSQATLPPLILPADRIAKASVWDDPGWAATRGSGRHGAPTSTVPNVTLTGQGARRSRYRPMFGADGDPNIPAGAFDGDETRPTPVATTFGHLPRDLSTEMRQARAHFDMLHDKYRDGKADHMREMIQHGTDLLHGPMSEMRERMNTIGGPELTRRFLSHYAMHPNTTFDPRNPSKHFEDHVGQSAGRAIADHLYDRHVQERMTAAGDRYGTARANAKQDNSADPEISEINARYRKMSRNQGASRNDLVNRVRDHTRQAEVNDVIRNRYLNDPNRKDLRPLTNLARGHMDVMAQSRGLASQLFGRVGGMAMDRWQRHVDLRRAHQQAMQATKNHLRMLDTKANAEQAAQASTPVSTPTAAPTAAAATPAGPTSAQATTAASGWARTPLRPRTNPGFTPRSGGTAMPSDAGASAPPSGTPMLGGEDDTPTAPLRSGRTPTQRGDPLWRDAYDDDAEGRGRYIDAAVAAMHRDGTPPPAAMPQTQTTAPPTAPPLPVPPITPTVPEGEVGEHDPLHGDAANDAIAQSEDVATHPKLGTYLLHPHGEGYRISRHPDGDEDRLLPVKGHGVFPTKADALDAFQEDKGGIAKYTMVHPHYDQGDGITASPPAVAPPAPVTPRVIAPPPVPKPQSATNPDLAAMNAKLNPPLRAGDTPARSSGRLFRPADVLGKRLDGGGAIPLFTYDRPR